MGRVEFPPLIKTSRGTMNSKKIIIRKSNMGDSRTCDFSQVSKEALLNASQQHISDVRQGMGWFIE